MHKNKTKLKVVDVRTLKPKRVGYYSVKHFAFELAKKGKISPAERTLAVYLISKMEFTGDENGPQPEIQASYRQLALETGLSQSVTYTALENLELSHILRSSVVQKGKKKIKYVSFVEYERFATSKTPVFEQNDPPKKTKKRGKKGVSTSSTNQARIKHESSTNQARRELVNDSLQETYDGEVEALQARIKHESSTNQARIEQQQYIQEYKKEKMEEDIMPARGANEFDFAAPRKSAPTQRVTPVPLPTYAQPKRGTNRPPAKSKTSAVDSLPAAEKVYKAFEEVFPGNYVLAKTEWREEALTSLALSFKNKLDPDKLIAALQWVSTPDASEGLKERFIEKAERSPIRYYLAGDSGEPGVALQLIAAHEKFQAVKGKRELVNNTPWKALTMEEMLQIIAEDEAENDELGKS